MTSLVKYGAFDIGALEQQNQKISDNSGGGADFMKIKEGRSRVRVLPPKEGRTTPFGVVREHFLTANNGTKVSFACPRHAEEPSPCPACEKGRELKSSGNPLDRKKADEHWPGLRVYVNVRDRAEPEGPRILGFGRQVWDSILRIAKDPEEGGDFTNPTDEGFDLIIDRTGTGKFDTKYTVSAARTSSPLDEDVEVVQRFIETQWDLDKYTRKPSLDEVLGMMRDGRQSGEESPAQIPPTTRTAKKPKPILQEEVYDVDSDDVPY